MKRTWAILLLLGLVFPSAALGVVQKDTLKSKIKAWAGGQDWSLYSSYNLVAFSDEVWKTVLNKDNLPLLRFGGGWYPLPNLAVDFAMGGMYEQAKSVGTISGAASGEEFKLYVVPVELGVRYRFKFLANQLVVPSVFAAYEWWYFREDPDSGDMVEGSKVGWRYGADLGLLLDPLDPDAAHVMKRDYGVTDTYLCLGYEVLQMDAAGGLDFSGTIYTASLRFDLGPDRAHAKP